MPQVNSMLGRLIVAPDNPPDHMPDPRAPLHARAAKAGEDLMEFALGGMLRQDGPAVLYLPSGKHAAGDLGGARHEPAMFPS